MKFLFCLLLLTGFVGSASIPDSFLAQWDLERSENFDEYLSARGVNWILRKLISLASVSKRFAKGTEPDTYSYHSNSTKENVAYNNWKLNVEFEGKGFDGSDHKIKFEMPDSNTLTEKHIRPNNSDDKAVYYKYTIENGELVLTLEDNGVMARRFFRRVV
ncbi:hypothetical protein M3Y94_00788700 [Aphelenchoides besseyi]|nr:hypothetical protein M3Y94_00788700 [Aphelenchoides besseyi]KAI6232426.1 Protein CBR-LBP-3 [Aphelenchoides besseyi]